MQFVTSREDAGQRLDQFLAARLPALSRSRIQQLIKGDCVRVSAGHVKPGLVVGAGLTVDVDIPPLAPAVPQPEAIPLSVLYQDADLVVLNKPAGMVVHPAPGHAQGTLVNALLHHVRDLSGIGGTARPGIVHRLDRGTSGVMVVAKHDQAHRALMRQFHDREVDKEYVALAWGVLKPGQTLDRPIGRDRVNRKKMSSRSAHARPALTAIAEVERFRGVSLASIRLGTGRTHQIRVHLSESGHPIVGDAVYGGIRPKVPAHLAPITRLERPFLHAARLSLTHPGTGKRLTFEAPLPPDLTDVLAGLRKLAT